MAVDLSTKHEPVSDLFPRVKSPSDAKKYALSDSQVREFHERGFIQNVPILNSEQVESLKVELAELVEPGHDGSELWYEYHSNESTEPDKVLFHALGAWRIRPALHDILWHAAFLAPASQLLGGAVRFWHDQLFCKPAHDGGVVAWHQDYSYWTRTKPMNHLTCWIGLDDSTRENGCVHYVPGSHRWPLLPRTHLANDMEAIRGVMTPDQLAEFKPVACEMKAGHASFHHPLMLHGSYANRSDRQRRAVVINVFLDGTRSDQNEPMLEGTNAVPVGQEMGGQFYPLLYDPLRGTGTPARP